MLSGEENAAGRETKVGQGSPPELQQRFDGQEWKLRKEEGEGKKAGVCRRKGLPKSDQFCLKLVVDGI